MKIKYKIVSRHLTEKSAKLAVEKIRAKGHRATVKYTGTYHYGSKNTPYAACDGGLKGK